MVIVSRNHKLIWTTVICAGLGILASEILGTQRMPLILILAFGGIAIGFLGLDVEGKPRNRKWVIGILIGLAIALVSLIIAIVYGISQSTDL